MIQDSARHTDIPRTGWKYSFLSGAATNLGGKGWMLAGEPPSPGIVPTSGEVSVPYLHGNQPSTGMLL